MKLKTHNASNKRFALKRSGKVMKRKNGQDHFNSRESGKTTRNKRRDFAIAKPTAKTLKVLNPYQF